MQYFLIIMAVALAACGGKSNGSPPAGGLATTAIHAVQGSGAASPLVGQAVTIEGVVVGDFQDGDADGSRNLSGFFVQGTSDDDSETSDGVFVFDGSSPPVDIASGDLVRITGTVNEYFGETQVSADSVTVIGGGSILPAAINLPAAATTTNSDGVLIADFEHYEGMLVRIAQTLTVSRLRELERYGEVQLSADGRQYSFTNQNAPDVADYGAHIEAVAARRLFLDDGLRAIGVKPIKYLDAGLTSGYSIRIGDEISGVTGAIRYSRGSGRSGTETYRLMPTAEPSFDSVNPRPVAPIVSGAIRVVSFNLDNFFSTVDTGAKICGPARDDNCRGADSPEEFSRQLGKIVTALSILDADVIGVVEMENNARASLQSLVDGINASVGAGTYTYVDTGMIGGQPIKVGLLYKSSTIQTVGSFVILDSNADPRFDDSRSRPVLAQTFRRISNGALLTIAVIHLKSKGSSCASSGDPDLRDGQSNCGATRTAAAAALADWLATDPTFSGDADVLIIGDPNAHTHENAITTLITAGYADLAEAFIGSDSYSFEYDGQSGTLDHALASASLLTQVVDVVEWHINADEPRLRDYDLEFGRDPGLFDGSTPYRASDHDPIIIGLDLTP